MTIADTFTTFSGVFLLLAVLVTAAAYRRREL